MRYFCHQCVHCEVCGSRCSWYHECEVAFAGEYVAVSIARSHQPGSSECNEPEEKLVLLATADQSNVAHVCGN